MARKTTAATTTVSKKISDTKNESAVVIFMTDENGNTHQFKGIITKEDFETLTNTAKGIFAPNRSDTATNEIQYEYLYDVLRNHDEYRKFQHKIDAVTHIELKNVPVSINMVIQYDPESNEFYYTDDYNNLPDYGDPITSNHKKLFNIKQLKVDVKSVLAETKIWIKAVVAKEYPSYTLTKDTIEQLISDVFY